MKLLWIILLSGFLGTSDAFELQSLPENRLTKGKITLKLCCFVFCLFLCVWVVVCLCFDSVLFISSFFILIWFCWDYRHSIGHIAPSRMKHEFVYCELLVWMWTACPFQLLWVALPCPLLWQLVRNSGGFGWSYCNPGNHGGGGFIAQMFNKVWGYRETHTRARTHAYSRVRRPVIGKKILDEEISLVNNSFALITFDNSFLSKNKRRLVCTRRIKNSRNAKPRFWWDFALKMLVDLHCKRPLLLT